MFWCCRKLWVNIPAYPTPSVSDLHGYLHWWYSPCVFKGYNPVERCWIFKWSESKTMVKLKTITTSKNPKLSWSCRMWWFLSYNFLINFKWSFPCIKLHELWIPRGNLNPAVSLGLALSGKMPWLQMPLGNGTSPNWMDMFYRFLSPNVMYYLV